MIMMTHLTDVIITIRALKFSSTLKGRIAIRRNVKDVYACCLTFYWYIKLQNVFILNSIWYVNIISKNYPISNVAFSQFTVVNVNVVNVLKN